MFWKCLQCTTCSSSAFFGTSHQTTLWEPGSTFSNLKYKARQPFAYEDVKECDPFLIQRPSTHSYLMNTSILDNKLGSTSDPLTTIVTEATNNFSESFTWEAPGSLAASFKYSILYKINKSKQSCNPHPLASSSLPLIYACRKVIVHFPCGQSTLQKKSYPPPTPTKEKWKQILPPHRPKT